ncbi:MAG: hypothetical protein DRJ03_19510 [Chloroflexi bacterium]|nr:MAG: hypothetical protein DRJ03_19510 [Chloroflexota bacterium]
MIGVVPFSQRFMWGSVVVCIEDCFDYPEEILQSPLTQSILGWKTTSADTEFTARHMRVSEPSRRLDAVYCSDAQAVEWISEVDTHRESAEVHFPIVVV